MVSLVYLLLARLLLCHVFLSLAFFFILSCFKFEVWRGCLPMGMFCLLTNMQIENFFLGDRTNLWLSFIIRVSLFVFGLLFTPCRTNKIHRLFNHWAQCRSFGEVSLLYYGVRRVTSTYVYTIQVPWYMSFKNDIVVVQRVYWGIGYGYGWGSEVWAIHRQTPQ